MLVAYKKLWIALALVIVISFAVLGGVGIRVLNNAPPIPTQVVTSSGVFCSPATRPCRPRQPAAEQS